MEWNMAGAGKDFAGGEAAGGSRSCERREELPAAAEEFRKEP
jgi:hypothetical protein